MMNEKKNKTVRTISDQLRGGGWLENNLILGRHNIRFEHRLVALLILR